MTTCPDCKELILFGKHKCAPIFYFKHPHWGDEFQEIRAWTYENAAEKFAQIFNDHYCYTLINSSEEVIISDGEVEKRFEVSAEQSIDYHVKEV